LACVEFDMPPVSRQQKDRLNGCRVASKAQIA
jgi:hypothetical protein